MRSSFLYVTENSSRAGPGSIVFSKNRVSPCELGLSKRDYDREVLLQIQLYRESKRPMTRNNYERARYRREVCDADTRP
jgi:hypothetical protein